MNLNFHLLCSLMRVNPKVNNLVLQVSFYAHTHNSKVTQAISCMLNEKLTSLFAIKPLILLKRLSLPPTLSFHTHPQLGGIGRGKKLPCQVSEWVSLLAEVITFWQLSSSQINAQCSGVSAPLPAPRWDGVCVWGGSLGPQGSGKMGVGAQIHTGTLDTSGVWRGSVALTPCWDKRSFFTYSSVTPLVSKGPCTIASLS